MEKIEIKNNRLRTYLEYELDKKQGEPIYKEELESITQVSLIANSFIEGKYCEELSDLLYFKNLKNCMIKDYLIRDQDINIINKLEKLDILHFDNCKFENKAERICLDVNKLILSFCKNIDIRLFNLENYIKYLRITSGKEININEIENYAKLTDLYLQSITINDFINITKLKDLQYLNLNGSNIIKNMKYIDKINAKVEYKKENLPV